MSKTVDLLERIEIERACEQLIYAYARALDLGNLSVAADMFAQNASMTRPMTPHQLIQGRDAIRAALLTRPKTLLTKHVTSNVAVQVESAESASSLSYLTMIACTPGAEEQPPFLSNGPIYFAEFKDRFVREQGTWKFQERHGSIQIKFGGAASA